MKRHGFSLLEVVIVVAIVAIMGAMAIPRVSRGVKGAGETVLAGDLRSLRDAIEHYASEHGGSYPVYKDLAGQLTRCTDPSGGIRASRDTSHRYGPYLQAIPPLPVGQRKGATGITRKTGTGGLTMGWVYDEATGVIHANCDADEIDETGTPYADY